jgi:hypothetical protein
MESQSSFEQAFPNLGVEAAPEKQKEKEREDRRKTLPETIWTRLDPDHLQPPKTYAAEAKVVPGVAEAPKASVNKEVVEQPRSSQPESIGDLLKAQALPNLDIRPQHFYEDAEIYSAHSAQEHDILPEVLPESAQQKVTQFSPQVEHEPTTTAIPEAAPVDKNLHLGRHELLLLAGTISAEDTNLLEIFNAKRIDEDGLRRIVAEFMQGKPIEKLLEQEELREQMKFELDPSLRHSPEATDGLISRLASGAGVQVKKVINPQRIKQHAGSAATIVAGSVERMLEARDTPPSPAKIVAWTVGVIVYFIVLTWALKR